MASSAPAAAPLGSNGLASGGGPCGCASAAPASAAPAALCTTTEHDLAGQPDAQCASNRLVTTAQPSDQSETASVAVDVTGAGPTPTASRVTTDSEMAPNSELHDGIDAHAVSEVAPTNTDGQLATSSSSVLNDVGNGAGGGASSDAASAQGGAGGEACATAPPFPGGGVHSANVCTRLEAAATNAEKTR